MAGSISITPMQTTTASGLFSVNSNGYTQGLAQDNPASKFELASGIIAVGQNPLYGGVPITESIGEEAILGNNIAWAVNQAGYTGFAVFNQGYQGITTPQSTVPLYEAGMTITFYRVGSGARIPVRLNPAFVATLDGEQINQQVSWDFTNNWITTYSVSAMPVTILDISIANNKTVSYSAGIANWLTTENIALIQI